MTSSSYAPTPSTLPRQTAAQPAPRWAACLLLLCLPAALRAQNQGDEDTVVLSPFVVSSDADVGYSSSQSVLGGRFKQQIKDIPSQIEVITPEMMEDFRITSLSDAFRYSLNTENLEEYISPQDGGLAFWSGKESGRIRGIQPSSFSTARNLFSSITKTDAFNTERFEIGSGAQSLIFSLGEPAGVANTKLKTAEMRNFGRVSVTVDSEEGHRVVFDVNRKLWKNKVAARFIYLNENSPSFIKPSYDRDERLYGTVTIQPFRGTTIRLHAESMNNDANLPPTQLPFDWATPTYTAFKSGDMSTVASATFGAMRNGVAFPSGANANQLPFYHINAVQVPTGPGQTPFDPVRFGPAALDPNTGVARVTFSPEDLALFPEVAAMVGKNFLGNGLRNEFDSKIYDAFIEQKITSTLMLEVAGHWEEWRRRQQSVVNYNNFGYYADINRLITTVPWNTNANQDTKVIPAKMPANYALNQNYGKLFTSGILNGVKNLEQSREFRASLAWEPVTPRSLRWLGSHSFFASYNYRDSFEKGQSLQVRLLGNLEYQKFNGPLSDARRQVMYQHYFDTGANLTAQLPVIGGVQRDLDALFNGFTITEATTGQTIEVSGWNTPYGGSGPSGDTTQLKSGILAWQGRLAERLMLSYGLRYDDVTNTNINRITQAAGGTNQQNGGWMFFDDPSFSTWDDSTRVRYHADSQTYGAVLRPLKKVSLSYYESSTFNLPTGQVTAFGDPIPGTNGSSKEYAIRIDSPSGDSFLKLNYYRLEKIGIGVGFGNVRIQSGRLETAYQKVVNDRANAFGTPRYEELILTQGLTNPDAWTAEDDLNSGKHPITGDVVSKGYELTAGTRWGNLDIRLTGARGTTVESNISKDWERWQNSRLPVWSDPALTDVSGNVGWQNIPYQGANANNFTVRLPNGTFRPMTMKEFYDNVSRPALNAAVQRNNKPVDAGRKYRVNLNASYSFKQGALKGVRAGGAVRWRSAPILGFPARDSGLVSGGYPIPELDLDNPYVGKYELNLDAFVSYSGRVSKALGYRIQLNARNLLTGEDSFTSTRMNALGRSVFTIIETPRSYALTLDLLF